MPANADSDAVLRWLRDARADVEAGFLGQGYQASVRRVPTPYGDCVIKRAHSRGWLGRLVGGSVAHESAVYGQLAGVPGVPRCHGLLDRRSLVLEFVPGASYRQKQHALENRDAFFTSLRATLEAMHAAGIAHGDLKRKDNILVGADERPYIIDFGIACIRRPQGGFFNRLWFNWFRQMDWNAWIKHKYGRRPQELPTVDRPLYRELWVERLARRIKSLTRKLTRAEP